MSRIGSPRRALRVLLALALLALLCVSAVSAFNPYEDEDDTGSGSVPETSTLSCTKDAVTGEEKCESVAKIVPDEEVLAEKIAIAEAEREAAAEKKRLAREEATRKMYEEREAKKERKRQEREAKEKAEEKDAHKPNTEDYKIKEPLKALKVDYYKFFGVERDAPKLKIRKAANTVAVANHPDKCPTKECMERMVVINQARDVLLNDETRTEYDFLLNYGFKIYDKELYDDMWKLFQEDPHNMPNGFADAPDFDSDFSDMNLTEESAGWLLLLTGSITLAMMVGPIIKFWEKSQTAEAKKAAQKKALLDAQVKNQAALGSLKKKQEKYTGERGAKRFDGASPSPSPKAGANTTAPARQSSPGVATAVTLVCCIGVFLSFVAPVAAASFETDVSISYYDLLEVATGAEAAALKKA